MFSPILLFFDKFGSPFCFFGSPFYLRIASFFWLPILLKFCMLSKFCQGLVIMTKSPLSPYRLQIIVRQQDQGSSCLET